jgi:disulfide bond formation protein DsbB
MGAHPALRVLGAIVILTLLWGAAALFMAGMRNMANPSDETVDVAGPSVQQPSAGGEPTREPASPDAEADGRTLFVRNCAACHGNDATGGIGKNLVTSEFLAGLTDQEAVAFIRKGRAVDDPANTTGVAMPPSGGNTNLTDEQLGAIVNHLRSLQQ